MSRYHFTVTMTRNGFTRTTTRINGKPTLIYIKKNELRTCPMCGGAGTVDK